MRYAYLFVLACALTGLGGALGAVVGALSSGRNVRGGSA